MTRSVRDYKRIDCGVTLGAAKQLSRMASLRLIARIHVTRLQQLGDPR
jgi:hypothetical protein